MKTIRSMDLGGSTLTPRGQNFFYRVTYYTLKGLGFLQRYRNNPLYAFYYLCHFWRPNYRERIYFLTDEEYLDRAKNTSTLRLGDGEFTLMLGTRDIIVQKFDPALKDFFYQVAREYNDSCPYLLALPPHLNITNSDLEKHNARYLWMPGKILFRMFFNHEAKYSDASFFYRDGMPRRFLNAVSAHKDVVYVTNAQNIEGLKNLTVNPAPEATSISYVETPPSSTFALREQVLKEIEKTIKDKRDTTVVVFACGPAGKVLARILAQKGVLAHDAGSGISFLLDGQSHEEVMNWKAFGPIFVKNRDHDRKNV